MSNRITDGQILGELGVTLGHVQSMAICLVTLIGLVNIAASTYLITHSHQIYPVFEPIAAESPETT